MTAVWFVGLVVLVALLLLVGLRRAGWRAAAMVGIVLMYLVIPAVLAKAGKLDRYNPLPAPALLVVAALAVTTVVLVFSRRGTQLALAIPLAVVVALQGFRIGVELLLHRLYLEGTIPVEMTYAGRNFDIVSGLTGLGLGAWMLSGRRVPRGVVLGWNLLGLALLANIVVVAVLATPVPFRRFVDGPPNLLPSTFPYVWLPSFLVMVALGSHLLVFRQLLHSRSSVISLG